MQNSKQVWCKICLKYHKIQRSMMCESVSIWLEMLQMSMNVEIWWKGTSRIFGRNPPTMSSALLQPIQRRQHWCDGRTDKSFGFRLGFTDVVGSNLWVEQRGANSRHPFDTMLKIWRLTKFDWYTTITKSGESKFGSDVVDTLRSIWRKRSGTKAWSSMEGLGAIGDYCWLTNFGQNWTLPRGWMAMFGVVFWWEIVPYHLGKLAFGSTDASVFHFD